MRSSSPSDRDLTTRARIRDAAIVVFGEQGFGTGVRAIATAAGISPGLVNHHFGSKDGLREVCDNHVLEVIRDDKAGFLTAPSGAVMLAKLAAIEAYAPLIAYIVRSFSAGGRLAESLFEHFVDNTADYLAAGVAAGTLRPSRDPAARARYFTLQGLGGLMIFFQTKFETDVTVDFGAALREYSELTTMPALEIFTEGLLTDSSLLDALVESRSTTSNQESA